MNINERFGILESKYGITDAEIAEKLKISKKMVAAYRAGKVNVPYKYVVKIIEVFNIDANWLIKGETDQLQLLKELLSAKDEIIKARDEIIKAKEELLMSRIMLM